MTALIDSVTARPYEDQYARQEWGWRHRYSVEDIVDDFGSVLGVDMSSYKSLIN